MLSRFYKGDHLTLLVQIFEWVFIIVNAPVGVYHFFTIMMKRKDVTDYLVNLIKHGRHARNFSVYSSSNTRRIYHN